MKRIAWIMMTMAALTCGLSVNAMAQGNLIYFPYLENDGETSTQLILNNLSGADANVSLITFDEGGIPQSENTVFVPAASQNVVGPASLGFGYGWVLGVSDAPGIVGNLRISSADGTAQDMSEAVKPASVILLPLLGQSFPAETEISVANANPNTGRVTLTLYNRTGSIVATRDSSLGPFAMYRGSLSSIFGANRDYSNASHVIARSIPANIVSPAVSIVGLEVVEDFARIPTDGVSQEYEDAVAFC